MVCKQIKPLKCTDKMLNGNFIPYLKGCLLELNIGGWKLSQKSGVTSPSKTFGKHVPFSQISKS